MNGNGNIHWMRRALTEMNQFKGDYDIVIHWRIHLD